MSDHTPSRYRWSFRGLTFDFYRLCEILGISHHAQAHALKKVIRAGRGGKPLGQDIDEAVDALKRWKEMAQEDIGSEDSSDFFMVNKKGEATHYRMENEAYFRSNDVACPRCFHTTSYGAPCCWCKSDSWPKPDPNSSTADPAEPVSATSLFSALASQGPSGSA